MQKRKREFDAAGIKLYAISYDPVEALKKFAAKNGIEFPLLSDQGSRVIREFGILNTLIQPDDEPKGFYGIPFPGTYVTDAQGRVTQKFFNEKYATRQSAGVLLGTALGKVLQPEGADPGGYQDKQVTITAFLADAVLRTEVESAVIIRLEMAPGLHVYGEPLPEGFIPTTVQVQAEGARIGPPRYPKTKSLAFPALGVTLPVWEGVGEIRVPITLGRVEKNAGPLPVAVEVRYQACSDRLCYPPKTARLTLNAPVAGLVGR